MRARDSVIEKCASWFQQLINRLKIARQVVQAHMLKHAYTSDLVEGQRVAQSLAIIKHLDFTVRVSRAASMRVEAAAACSRLRVIP